MRIIYLLAPWDFRLIKCIIVMVCHFYNFLPYYKRKHIYWREFRKSVKPKKKTEITRDWFYFPETIIVDIQVYFFLCAYIIFTHKKVYVWFSVVFKLIYHGPIYFTVTLYHHSKYRIYLTTTAFFKHLFVLCFFVRNHMADCQVKEHTHLSFWDKSSSKKFCELALSILSVFS